MGDDWGTIWWRYPANLIMWRSARGSRSISRCGMMPLARDSMERHDEGRHVHERGSGERERRGHDEPDDGGGEAERARGGAAPRRGASGATGAEGCRGRRGRARARLAFPPWISAREAQVAQARAAEGSPSRRRATRRAPARGSRSGGRGSGSRSAAGFPCSRCAGRTRP